jgi:hypothetical protein
VPDLIPVSAGRSGARSWFQPSQPSRSGRGTSRQLTSIARLRRSSPVVVCYVARLYAPHPPTSMVSELGRERSGSPRGARVVQMVCRARPLVVKVVGWLMSLWVLPLGVLQEASVGPITGLARLDV